MRRFLLIISVLILTTSFVDIARAQDVCESNSPGLALGPLSIGMFDGQHGLARRACPRTEAYLLGDAYLLADTPNFYGNIRINATLGGSWAITDRTEVFGAIEFFRFQTVISSIAAKYFGSGYFSLGVLQKLLETQRLTLSFSSRLVLPLSGIDDNSKPVALDVGANVAFAPHRTVRIHGSVMLGGSIGLSAGPAEPRGVLNLYSGVDWHPLRWLGVVVELNGSIGYRSALNYLSISGGFRFAAGERFGIELAILYPFVGAERALIAGVLQLSWRFGRGEEGVADEGYDEDGNEENNREEEDNGEEEVDNGEEENDDNEEEDDREGEGTTDGDVETEVNGDEEPLDEATTAEEPAAPEEEPAVIETGGDDTESSSSDEPELSPEEPSTESVENE